MVILLVHNFFRIPFPTPQHSVYTITAYHVCMKMSKKCVVLIMDWSNEKVRTRLTLFFIMFCSTFSLEKEKSKGHHH